MKCFFVSDLHGNPARYNKLFERILIEKPDGVLFGGDLLPHKLRRVEHYDDFTLEFLFPQFNILKQKLGTTYPRMILILGNDDPRIEEQKFIAEGETGLFTYANQRKIMVDETPVYGYSFIPPSPFQLKDWEKYDVSRYADPGCIHPTEGFRTIDPDYDTEYSTIQKDLDAMNVGESLKDAVFLFHSPPYKTYLDRAALDGKMIDYVPLDLHVGSIAIKRFIEEKQPLITLHGHIHESTRLTGHWKEQIGRTMAFNASHDGPELCLIRFDTRSPELAVRELI